MGAYNGMHRRRRNRFDVFYLARNRKRLGLKLGLDNIKTLDNGLIAPLLKDKIKKRV